MLRYFSGYTSFGLWNIAVTAVALLFSHPPDLKHQEDVLSAYKRSRHTGEFSFWYDILANMKYIVGSASFLVLLLCLSVFIFDPTNLYYEFVWLDIPMHFLGGVGVASFFNSIASFKKKKMSLLSVLFLYLVVALMWELYEFAKDILNLAPGNGWVDTIADLINGAVGATVAYFFSKK